MNMVSLILLAAQAASAQSTVPPVPPLRIDLSREAVEAKAAKEFDLGGWQITPAVRGGELAPGGSIAGALPTTLKRSPYFGAGLKAVHAGDFETMIMADASRATLNSAKPFDDPSSAADSPAARGAGSHSESMKGLSFYMDAGKVVELGGRARAAFYTAVEFWQTKRGQGGANRTVGMAETSAGAAVLAPAGRGEVSAGAQLRMESAPRDRFNNGHTAQAFSAAANAEYARPAGRLRAAAGVAASTQRADDAVRPYLTVGGRRLSTVVAGEFRRSKDPFHPDVKGAAVGFTAAASDRVTVSVEGRAERRSYELSAQPLTDFRVTGEVAVDVGRILRVAASQRTEARDRRSAYRPADSYAMNGRLSGPDYRALFDAALRESATLDEFTARIPADGIDGILAAVSAFTRSFSALNYNYDAPNTPNLDDLDALYVRGRRSYLTGDRDGTLICIGSAQFAANLARALATRTRTPLVASAVTVAVPGGHAVTAIQTPEYGIVFADWGRLTPTGTMDTKEALAVYQALQGVPSVYHQVADGRTGRHVGYLFTDEGKALVRRLTFHSDAGQAGLPALFADAPRGSDVAAARYQALLRERR